MILCPTPSNEFNAETPSECFTKYVKSKVLKRMESYRLKNDSSHQQRKLLLPVSGGVSSVVLLQVLDSHIQRQLASRGRAAYDLEVLVIDKSSIDQSPSPVGLVECFKDTFPHSRFSLVSLDAVFKIDYDIHDALSSLGFHMEGAEEPQAELERLMKSATTPTTRADLFEILLLRLIVGFAKCQACEGILWGHSDSRLAAIALSNVAKGRGGALPNQIGDGSSPWGLNFNYPLRDLFKSELELYAGLLSTRVSKIIIPDLQAPAVSSIRETSIDDLLTIYITSQGEKYPSIMANVVRTASKLRMPATTGADAACRLCATPITSTPSELSRSGLCYGCLKIKFEIKPIKGA
jgi:cytoplasmic tRNA 2-thiolation protein 2